MTTATKMDAVRAVRKLHGFIGKAQLRAIGDCMRGEEKQFFFDKMVELAEIVSAMPKTYETDRLGDKALARLHYFNGSMDWYITEKDKEAEQLQAFGLANLGYGGELDYISIAELLENDVELDMYYHPQTLAEISGEARRQVEMGPTQENDKCFKQQ